MSEHRRYSGPDLAPLLRRVRDELGSDAEIIRAERIRSGGLAGFFAREHYEVVAKRPEVDPSAPSEPAGPARTKQNGPDDSMAGERIIDEPINRQPTLADKPDVNAGVTRAEPASLPAPLPASTGPETAEPAVAGAGGSTRSIQAALLDRADRVSTEELLVRIAETHSPEWGGESFQSILGRAMVDWASPSGDVPSVDENRPDDSQVRLGPRHPAESIDALRLETIRTGENVVEPASPTQSAATEASAEESADQVGARSDRLDVDPEHSASLSAIDDGWRGPADGYLPSQWADGVTPPPWGPPWIQGWPPWMVNGWPGYNPGDPSAGTSAPHLCANCSDPVASDGQDHDEPSPRSPRDRDITAIPNAVASWSELGREIDDIRRRLDDIVGTLRDATGDEFCDCGREPCPCSLEDGHEPEPERPRSAPGADGGRGSGDRRRPVNARSEHEQGPGRPNRRGKNSRRSDRTDR
ncbi:MAG: hypothetical protein OEZ14_00915 [Acidimicrobiia bacterium]|nr:hypothetical protein [Acidimicrobiia bacterium]